MSCCYCKHSREVIRDNRNRVGCCSCFFYNCCVFDISSCSAKRFGLCWRSGCVLLQLDTERNEFWDMVDISKILISLLSYYNSWCFFFFHRMSSLFLSFPHFSTSLDLEKGCNIYKEKQLVVLSDATVFFCAVSFNNSLVIVFKGFLHSTGIYRVF